MKKSELVKTIRTYSLLSILLLGVLIVSTITGLEYYQYRKDVDAIRTDYLEEQKDVIKNRVLEFIEYVEFVRSTQRKHVEQNLKTRVDSAVQTIANLHERYENTLPEEELENIIKDALRTNRFETENNYYFIEDSKGNNVLFAYSPEMEGLNYWNLQDAKGNFTVQDEVSKALRDGEGYVTGYWPKPRNYYGEAYEKLTYVKYYEPFDWIVGTGTYLDEMETQAQNEVLERMEALRFGQQGYIFANTYDGIALVLDGKVVESYKNIWELEDPNGFKVIQAERDAVRNPDGDYIYYVWNKLQNDKIAPKVSFIKGIENWEWMIGSGVYLDDVEIILAQRQEQLFDRLLTTLIDIGILSMLALIIMLSISRKISNKIERNITLFTEFFEKASSSDKYIEVEHVAYDEFKKMAHHANEMLEVRSAYKEELKALNQNLESKVEERTLELQKNIEDLKALQDKLIQKEKMAIVGELVPGFAHDINTPVGVSITANSYIKETTNKLQSALENGTLKKSTAEKALRDIEESAEIIESNLKTSSEQVQSLKRLSIDQNTDEYRAFDLMDYLKEIVLSLKPLTKSGNHSVHMNGPQSLLIHSYPGIYFQIFSNLISNSVMHGFMGRERGEIVIEVKEVDGSLTILYTDNGVGIDPDHIDKIFNPYFTTKKHSGGSGIGLNIVYNLVTDTMGGKIKCQSEVNGGTSFRLDIPKNLKDQ